MNQLFYGDNLDVLRRHVLDETADLIYWIPLQFPTRITSCCR